MAPSTTLREALMEGTLEPMAIIEALDHLGEGEALYDMVFAYVKKYEGSADPSRRSNALTLKKVARSLSE